jgi:RHS repeat-associated protein
MELPAEMRNLPDLRNEFNISLNARSSDKLYYFHANHLGSGSLITDGSGNTYQTLAYAPHGETLVNIRTGSYDERYRFGGHIKDEESNLHNYGARYFDDNLGPISPDACTFEYPHLSAYNHTGNNPIMNEDVDGNKIQPYRNKILWWYNYNYFSNAHGEAFHNLKESMLQNNKIFTKVYNQLENSKQTYTVKGLNMEYTDSYIRGKQRGNDIYLVTNSKTGVSGYSNKGVIFEEFFHAGQKQFYGKNSPSLIDIEVEAKVAKSLSGIKEEGGFNYNGLNNFIAALNKGNVSIEQWSLYYGELEKFAGQVSALYSQYSGNPASNYDMKKFTGNMFYLESLIGKELSPNITVTPDNNENK